MRLRASLLAALLLSAAAHAAVALVIDTREPIEGSVAASPGSPASAPRLHASLAPAVAPATASPATSAAVEAVPPARHRSVAPTRTAIAAPARPSDDRLAAAGGPVDAPANDRVDRGPAPLTYPVISLPPDDDPRRVGLVRLMLVVSSEGRVVKTVVTAATLSQDYVDRIAESFEAVRFEPATVHGLPRASWYEVVVDFTFDPGAAPAV